MSADIRRRTGTALAAISLLLACFLAQAQPVLGREYQELSPPRPVSSGERVEVIEFFYYGCPVCYESQPHIAKWLAKTGPGIAMLRVPAVFTESSESFARTFYTLGAMNQIARLHWPLYDNHHFDGKQLNEEKNVVAWVAGNGLDAMQFTELWHSEKINLQVDAAKKALDTYGVKGVPSFVVDGRYITSARMAGGTKQMMTVVQFLVERAAAERRKK
jgi:protein dithiol oxidoreductase (disulfide-forming)